MYDQFYQIIFIINYYSYLFVYTSIYKQWTLSNIHFMNMQIILLYKTITT